MKKGLNMTRAEAEAHQKKHGFSHVHFSDLKRVEEKRHPPTQIPKPRQNKTEQAFGLILESMKRRGELIDYKPFGIRLEWGAHPETEKPQIYSPDFTVWEVGAAVLRLIEVKGPHIWPKDRIRFRGCRATWGMWFRFEMWQKKDGVWTRIE